MKLGLLFLLCWTSTSLLILTNVSHLASNLLRYGTVAVGWAKLRVTRWLEQRTQAMVSNRPRFNLGFATFCQGIRNSVFYLFMLLPVG